MKFYRCKHCGNIICMVEDQLVNPVCCGEKMEELHANTVDASVEKHTPVVTWEDCFITVFVGSVAHPMTAEHYIKWICLETTKGSQIHYLNPTDAPTTTFVLSPDEQIKAVYAYCNLHGLWKYGK